MAIGDIPDGGEDPVGVAKGGLSLPGQVGAVPEEVHALTAESSNLQQARCLNQYLGERAEQPTKTVVLTKRTKESMYLAFFFMRYLKWTNRAINMGPLYLSNEGLPCPSPKVAGLQVLGFFERSDKWMSSVFKISGSLKEAL